MKGLAIDIEKVGKHYQIFLLHLLLPTPPPTARGEEGLQPWFQKQMNCNEEMRPAQDPVIKTGEAGRKSSILIG